MYESFFGFREKPFSLLPDPAFLYASKHHEEALTLLEYGLMNQAGFIVLTGEIGVGKTTLMRQLLQRLEDSLTVGLISNTHAGLGGLLSWICAAFDLPVTGAGAIEQHRALSDFLVAQYAKGRRTLLILDEAQNLELSHLEELRLLSNINSDKDLLLQLMLLGQPQLRTLLARPELEQFVQRIAAAYHLTRLESDETPAYIRHRLHAAGAWYQVFDDAACDAVHYYSNGVPRLINLICDTALVYAYGAQSRFVTESLIDEVVESQSGQLLVHLADPAARPRGARALAQAQTPPAGESGAAPASEPPMPRPSATAEASASAAAASGPEARQRAGIDRGRARSGPPQPDPAAPDASPSEPPPADSGRMRARQEGPSARSPAQPAPRSAGTGNAGPAGRAPAAPAGAGARAQPQGMQRVQGDQRGAGPAGGSAAPAGPAADPAREAPESARRPASFPGRVQTPVQGPAQQDRRRWWPGRALAVLLLAGIGLLLWLAVSGAPPQWRDWLRQSAPPQGMGPASPAKPEDAGMAPPAAGGAGSRAADAETPAASSLGGRDSATSSGSGPADGAAATAAQSADTLPDGAPSAGTGGAASAAAEEAAPRRAFERSPGGEAEASAGRGADAGSARSTPPGATTAPGADAAPGAPAPLATSAAAASAGESAERMVADPVQSGPAPAAPAATEPSNSAIPAAASAGAASGGSRETGSASADPAGPGPAPAASGAPASTAPAGRSDAVAARDLPPLRAALAGLGIEVEPLAGGGLRGGLGDAVQFSGGSVALDAEAEVFLERLAARLLAHGSLRVRVLAHTDLAGGAAVNQRLSEQRAAAVARVLAEAGLPAARITHEGRGESEPKVPLEQEWALGPSVNRRIELELSPGDRGAEPAADQPAR